MATSFTPASLINALIPASITGMYTVPLNTSVKISQMTITNTDSGASHAVSIYLAPSSSINITRDLLVTVVLSPGQSYSVYQAINQVLNASGTIQAQADADSVVNIKASGVLIV
jgi:hypothetical protein